MRNADSSSEGLKQLGQEIAGHLQTEVSAINIDNFLVRPHRQAVEKYSEEEAWEFLGTADYAEVAAILAGLPTELEPKDETAKRFDLLILKIRLAVFRRVRSTFTSMSGERDSEKSCQRARCNVMRGPT